MGVPVGWSPAREPPHGSPSRTGSLPSPNRQNLIPDPCFYHPNGVATAVTGWGAIACRTSSAGHTYTASRRE